MPKQLIQGIECHYRGLRDGERILYENLPQSEQKFQRVQHPFTDEELISIANKELLYEKYNEVQKKWVDEQKKIFDEGIYAYINGILRFIPGAYWAYVNFWTLEHGDKPDYREDDRLFFLFHEYLRLETDCLGITRGKGRRQGATSIGTFFMWFVAGRQERKNCGLTSYNDPVAQEVFQKMFLNGFKSMLPCFQEDFDSDSENFVRFVKPVDKKRRGVLAVAREGLNSYVDYRPNTINSYDSGRQSYNVPDEAGKRHKVNINSYWSKLYKTFLVGSNKVGFGYLPTTVNKKNEGGAEYKIFWRDANQYAVNPKTKNQVGIHTVNRCVQYFVPATHCFAGCIDEFGNSVIEDPVEPILSNEGKMIYEGSRTIILRERKRIEEEGEPEQYMEHRRDYPLDIYDMFAFETGNCEFNETRVIHQIELLELDPVPLRRVRFDYHEKIEQFANLPVKTKRYITWMDDNKGDWLLLEEPVGNLKNKFTVSGDIVSPQNVLHYCIGVDTFRIGHAEHGSKGTICVFKKSNIIGDEDEGNYPVAMYVGRPRLLQHLYDEVIKACLFYGCKVNFEISAGDFFYGYFYRNNTFKLDFADLMYWTPAVDPMKKNPNIKPGTESASPFELAAQLEAAKVYVDGTSNSGYNGNVEKIKFPDLLRQLLEYNHSERTPYDQVIALMMALLPALKSTNVRKYFNPKPKQLLPTYKITVPN